MSIVIFDEDRKSLKKMQRLVKEVAPQSQLILFDDYNTIENYANRNKISILFISFDRYGFEIAKRIKDKCPVVNIIVYSTDENDCLDAFKIHASGYIRRPVTYESIQNEMNELRY